MKCKEGHECTKAPFSRGGFYCEICHPSYHEMYQKMKADRVAKMQMGKKTASRSYTTVVELKEIKPSDQAKLIKANQNDITEWDLEHEDLDAKIRGEEDAGITPDEKDITRRSELLELIASAQKEITELTAQLERADDTGKVSLRGGRERQEFIPFNALSKVPYFEIPYFLDR